MCTLGDEVAVGHQPWWHVPVVSVEHVELGGKKLALDRVGARRAAVQANVALQRVGRVVAVVGIRLELLGQMAQVGVAVGEACQRRFVLVARGEAGGALQREMT